MESENQLIAEWNEVLLNSMSHARLPSDRRIYMSDLILWWMNLPVISNPVCLCLKPALKKSVSDFPWYGFPKAFQ